MCVSVYEQRLSKKRMTGISRAFLKKKKFPSISLRKVYHRRISLTREMCPKDTLFMISLVCHEMASEVLYRQIAYTMKEKSLQNEYLHLPPWCREVNSCQTDDEKRTVSRHHGTYKRCLSKIILLFSFMSLLPSAEVS